jgi:hypothetical protein
MSAEMIIGSVLVAIILLRWLKWLRGDGENEEFDWLILALGVVAALTLAWRFLNPSGHPFNAPVGLRGRHRSKRFDHRAYCKVDCQRNSERPA